MHRHWHLDAAHRHTRVLASAHHGDVLRPGDALDFGRNLVNNPLLQLQTVGDPLSDATELRETENLVFSNVADRQFASERQQMVFAETPSPEATDSDELIGRQ